MKKIKRISILLCSLFGLTGCGGLEMVATEVFGGILLDNTLLKPEPQEIPDEETKEYEKKTY